jgi:hypothetical protein
MEDKMDKKCEWKDGKFLVCRRASQEFHSRQGYDFCPYCGGDIRKPVEIKVGMFGKFWDNEVGFNEYGTLSNIDVYEKYPYRTAFNSEYKHFTPGLPEGFNQDGTPK